MTDLTAVCPACGGTGDAVVARWFGSSHLLRCRSCRSEWVHPQPSDARLEEIYSPDYYEPWSFAGASGVDAMKRRTFGPLLDRCALEPGASILDVGCATGSFLRFAADRGLKTYGVDLNEQAILEAAALVPDGSFYAGTLADDPFPGRSFDAIAMNDFIEHVREPRAELSFAAARLARGGRLAISTPRADSLTRRLLKGAWPQYREEHLTYFSRDGLRTLLEECGLRVVVSAITRKAVTLGYVYGQAKAYPAPVITPVTAGAYKALPFARNTTMRLPFGEMTVIAVRA